ncbi:hypothetical protein OSB04_012152 [Centaurea solstitialis]|uniref:Uncharacterized protein n=1 Tax=Centaurea solstitialis TaxID=347529 RepID=A0AA38TIE5_9ASTR|nr:hypothetical protein OSB04_012152 [Centaurea solstitialis]
MDTGSTFHMTSTPRNLSFYFNMSNKHGFPIGDTPMRCNSQGVLAPTFCSCKSKVKRSKVSSTESLQKKKTAEDFRRRSNSASVKSYFLPNGYLNMCESRDYLNRLTFDVKDWTTCHDLRKLSVLMAANSNSSFMSIESQSKPPTLNREEFQQWKIWMIYFFEGIHPKIAEYLHNPPYIPVQLIPRVIASATTPEIPEYYPHKL